MVEDWPLNPPVMQLDSTPWQPKDDDDTTLGLIPMREGLYLSRNLATIKLGMALGEQTVIGEGRRYGITTPLSAYPAIHIGAQSVKPIEMIAAYTAFATLGPRSEPIGILRVERRPGRRSCVTGTTGARRRPTGSGPTRSSRGKWTGPTVTWRRRSARRTCVIGTGSIPAPSRRRRAPCTRRSTSACLLRPR